MKDLGKKLSQLEHWNNGENHLIFNLFSGTWPDYLENLSFDYGKALIAKASFSDEAIRQKCDISIYTIISKQFSIEESHRNKK